MTFPLRFRTGETCYGPRRRRLEAQLPLREDEVVHHDNKHDNRSGNIVVFSSQRAHGL